VRSGKPFVREAGNGPGVVCAHANASTSSQWRDLMALLASRFRVLAPDLYGAGRSPPWPPDRVLTLGDEVALIEPVLQDAGAPFALVGHSYGAAVALIAAVRNPGRVRAMALYEPTLFALIDAQTPPPNAADGIRDAVAAGCAALAAGNPELAAQRFIDYWMHPGAWARTPDPRKAPIVESVRNIPQWANALFSESTPLSAFHALEVPVLYMTGTRSTAAAQGVARILGRALPRVEIVEFEGLGHMGPVTDPARVNAAIARFLDRA
jgi:pimeloyl-ACP methyl ester carboxylesterase